MAVSPSTHTPTTHTVCPPCIAPLLPHMPPTFAMHTPVTTHLPLATRPIPPPPPVHNYWHILVKTLPFPQLLLRMVKIYIICMQKQFYLSSSVEQPSSYSEAAMKLFLLLCAFSFVHQALSFFVFEGVSEGMLCILIYLSLWNFPDIMFIYWNYMTYDNNNIFCKFFTKSNNN